MVMTVEKPPPIETQPIETPPGRTSWSDAVWVATSFAWFGLIAGFAEAVVLPVARTTSCGHFLFINEHFVWMKPLAEAVVFTALGMPLLLLAPWLPRRGLLFVSAGFISFLACASILASSGWLNGWGTLFLSLGIAWQAAHFARDRTAGFLRLVRRTTPWLAAAVVVIAAGLTGRRAWDERAALQGLPEPAAGAPNVLLVTLDTVRAQSLKLYNDSGVETPHLEALAEQGVLFEQAIAPASWTLPSHASMFTGRYPHQLSTDWWGPLDDREPTLAEALRDRGYATSGFVANTRYCSRPTGLARGFVHYEDFPLSLGEVLQQSLLVGHLELSAVGFSPVGVYDRLGRKTGDDVTGGFLRWVDRQERRPFFAFLNYMDAHDPYLPERLVEGDRKLSHHEKLLMRNWWQLDPEDLSEQDLELARLCYESMIRELDAEMGRLLAELDRRGLRENTLVIITSDHGEQFGEHGVCFHGNSLYRPVVHVPLIVSWPEHVPTQRRVTTAVTLRDLAATVLDLIGAEQGILPGNSVRTTWAGSRAADAEPASTPFSITTYHPRTATFPMQRHSPAAKGTMYSLLNDGDYLIREGDGAERLYDFFDDPLEQNDLAPRKEHRPRLDRTRQALDWFLEAGEAAPRPAASSETTALPVTVD